MRTILLTLLIAIASFTQAAENSPTIPELITQLSDANADRSIAAMAGLRAAGEPARDALKACAATASGTAKSRAEILLGVLDTAPFLKQVDDNYKKLSSFEMDEEHATRVNGVTMKATGHSKINPATHHFIHDSVSEMGALKLPSRLVCDGVTMYNEETFPGLGTQVQKSVFKFSFAKYQRNEPSLHLDACSHMLSEEFDFTAVREETIDGAACYVVTGVSRPINSQEMKKANAFTLWPKGPQHTCVARIDKNDLLLRKVELLNEKNVTLDTITFSNIKCDVTLDESQFAYSPPAGVKIIDADLEKNPMSADATAK